MSKHYTVYIFGKEDEEQRLEHRDDGVYVFDWSGDTPESCDDGPLRAVAGSKCFLYITPHNDVGVVVPVWSVRDDEMCTITMGLRCFQQLVQLVPGMTVSRSESYRVMASDVFKAEALSLSLNDHS
jgi:hypothetical protein